MNYTSLFAQLRSHLIEKSPCETKKVTASIKEFFRDKFSANHEVLCSHEKGSEYLADVLVTSFNPRLIVQKINLNIIPTSLNVILAAESELGGESASSPYGVMKNVVEDYLKLLIVSCQYRVMIFTSLPYSGEKDHVSNRVETLRELYARAPGLTSGVLLVHLYGTQPISSQVRVSVSGTSIRGFEVSSDGLLVNEIKICTKNQQ